MNPRFDRFLTDEQKQPALPQGLNRGGNLRFIVDDLPGIAREYNDPNALDAHIREGNQLMIYHGTARVFIVTFSRGEAVKLGAAKSFVHMFQKHFDGMKEAYDKRREFRAEFKAYMLDALRTIKQKAMIECPAWRKFYHNHKEGYWQNCLCRFYGRDAQPGVPWIVVDREAILGFPDTPAKREFYDQIHGRWNAAKRSLQESAPKRWGTHKVTGKETNEFGDELDMLALTRDGHLACIELKHGTNGDIGWVPFQSAIYGQAFDQARQWIGGGIRNLVEQKIELGLLPAHVRARLPKDDVFSRVEPIVAIAKPLGCRHSCWEKMDELRSTYERNGAFVPVFVTDNDKLPAFVQAPLLRKVQGY